jgi:LytS/YehU family sensor histidine kinase
MRRLQRSAGFAIAAATFLSLLEIFRTTMSLSLEGRLASWAEIGARVLPVWVTLIAVSPWCALMASRFPFRQGRLVRALLAHLAGAAVFILLHMLLIGLWGHLATIPGAHPRASFGHYYVMHATLEVSMYAGIVMILLLLDARQEAAERAVAAARLAERLAAARLDGLRAQLQPHFLFNTLNTLAVLARRGDGAAVDRALVDLGDLLRASLDTGERAEVRLAEELAFVDRYVGLQRLRFPDRLDIAWSVAEDARGAFVPALVLQPLVENAIEHGLARAQGGRVEIAARRDGDALEILVADDGPGFGGEAREGVGLANTRERLALLYGPRGSLTRGNRPGGGGEVRLRLPWRDREPGEPAA